MTAPYLLRDWGYIPLNRDNMNTIENKEVAAQPVADNGLISMPDIKSISITSGHFTPKGGFNFVHKGRNVYIKASLLAQFGIVAGPEASAGRFTAVHEVEGQLVPYNFSKNPLIGQDAIWKTLNDAKGKPFQRYELSALFNSREDYTQARLNEVMPELESQAAIATEAKKLGLSDAAIKAIESSSIFG